MTTKRAPKTLTPDEIRYAVRLAQRVRMLDRRYMQGGAGHTPLQPALREARGDRTRGVKVLTAAGLDDYGYPPDATLTPEQHAVRVLDDVLYLPRREQADDATDGFEPLDAYVARCTADHAWAKRAPLIRAAALAGDAGVLSALAADPWAGWDPETAHAWKAMRVDAYVAQQLDACGITPVMLAPIVGMVRCLPREQRNALIGCVDTALRRGAEVYTW